MENYQEVEMFHHGNISVAVDGLCFILDRQSPDGNVFFHWIALCHPISYLLLFMGVGEENPGACPGR
jgi:hypothetical protein